MKKLNRRISFSMRGVDRIRKHLIATHGVVWTLWVSLLVIATILGTM